VTAFIGIETLGGVTTRLIERNTTIPVRKSEVLSTAADNQTTVSVRSRASGRWPATTDLGRFSWWAFAGAADSQIRSFDIDANGIVTSGQDLAKQSKDHHTSSAASAMEIVHGERSRSTAIRRKAREIG
jgi:molecular chaperone DnaK